MRTEVIYRDAKWPIGTWGFEPDWVEFEVGNGLKCLMIRNFGGAWCGYVGFKPSAGFDANCLDDSRVHGGITFSQGYHSCPLVDLPEGWWMVGFDCAHSADLCPAWLRSDYADIMRGGVYRDFQFALSNTLSLALEVASICR